MQKAPGLTGRESPGLNLSEARAALPSSAPLSQKHPGHCGILWMGGRPAGPPPPQNKRLLPPGPPAAPFPSRAESGREEACAAAAGGRREGGREQAGRAGRPAGFSTPLLQHPGPKAILFLRWGRKGGARGNPSKSGRSGFSPLLRCSVSGAGGALRGCCRRRRRHLQAEQEGRAGLCPDARPGCLPAPLAPPPKQP